jgi:hypothetical protein
VHEALPMTRRETLFAFAAGLLVAATAEFRLPIQAEARELPPIVGVDFTSYATMQKVQDLLLSISRQVGVLEMKFAPFSESEKHAIEDQIVARLDDVLPMALSLRVEGLSFADVLKGESWEIREDLYEHAVVLGPVSPTPALMAFARGK